MVDPDNKRMDWIMAHGSWLMADGGWLMADGRKWTRLEDCAMEVVQVTLTLTLVLWKGVCLLVAVHWAYYST